MGRILPDCTQSLELNYIQNVDNKTKGDNYMATWLLVGNASRARLFETQARPKTATLIKEFLHPPSREKGEDLASDRAGHFQAEAQGMEGTTHGAFNEATSPKEYEHERFAIELAKELNDGRTQNQFDNLLVVASPHFHGLLNQHLNNHVAKMVTVHVNKDYTDLDETTLLEKVREAMPMPKPA